MEPQQSAGLDSDRSNVNNGGSAPEKLNDFEKEQAAVAHKFAQDIIAKQPSATKGKAGAIADLKGKHRVAYPSIETIPQPRPVDFALQGSDIYILSFTETHPHLSLTLRCPNCNKLLKSSGWAQKARCCHAFDRTNYIVSRKYVCKPCEGESLLFYP